MTSIRPLRKPGTVGVVGIGRNEGERLRYCLESVRHTSDLAVYVDSGSSDNSVALSRSVGIEVVELDPRTPFSAARARNEGFRRLLEMDPRLDYVFFVDGDCEVVQGWLGTSCRFLDEHPEVAVVWGRRRERYPEKSIYNMLCDIEWEGSAPPGETKVCGGDALVRVTAFQQVNGYHGGLICGEEPELCVRLRKAGWRIWRLGEDMTLHDAAMHRFGQWWKRMVRSGYAYAQGASLHGASPERHWVRESRRAWNWGLCIPLVVLFLTAIVGCWVVVLLMIYPLQVIRLAMRGRRPTRENWWRAGALVLGTFPEMLGQLKFVVDRGRGVRSGIIEYK